MVYRVSTRPRVYRAYGGVPKGSGFRGDGRHQKAYLDMQDDSSKASMLYTLTTWRFMVLPSPRKAVLLTR